MGKIVSNCHNSIASFWVSGFVKCLVIFSSVPRDLVGNCNEVTQIEPG